MAESTQNSFSDLIENFIILQNNAFLILQKISESTTDTKNDTLTFTLSDVDGDTEIEYTIPTYNYFRKAIERIDNTINSMLALEEGSDASIRNADGTYSSVYKYSIRREPTAITQVTSPTRFSTKPNWFFEDYMNPYLKVTFDVSSFVKNESAKVKVKRIILNCNTREEIEAFEAYNGSNNVSLDTLISKWTAKGYSYVNDENIYDLSIGTLAYNGKFTILGKVEDDGDNLYVFDTFRYSENGNPQKYTKELSVGAQLSYKETIYEVASINVNLENPQVKLVPIKGYDRIGVGKEMEIYSPVKGNKTVEVGIGYNEREVIFFKSIDSENNIMSSTWSAGVGFYTNDLVMTMPDGKDITLKAYYDNYVDDYGYVMKGLMKNNTVPAYYGETPNAPSLVSTNFTVVRINDHLYDTAEREEIRSKAAEKAELESDIEQLNTQISSIKTRLYNNNYTKDVDRVSDESDLKAASDKRANVTASYNAVVKSLNSMKVDGAVDLSSPKYRIRGFFDIPSATYNKITGAQEVAQFEIRYMYKSVDDIPSNTQQFDFIDSQSTSKLSTFTNWNFVKGPVRSKTYDSEKGIYVWETPEMSDANADKCNQVDIPITKGEKVVIQVRSLSEAGWPDNPVTSAWSNEVEISFPAELTTSDTSQTAFDGISEELTRVKLQEDMEAVGIYDHLKDSSTLGSMYWTHNANSINSGFTTSAGVIMSLYEKLQEQDKLIKELQDKISAAKPSMVVSIIDAEGNEINVSNQDTVKLNTCYYEDELESLSDSEKTGAIITKTYYIVIKNESGSALELVSKYPGAYLDDFSDFDETSTDAWAKKGYDLAPIVYNLDASETGSSEKFHPSNWTSSQLLSQFMYSRFYDLGGKSDLFWKDSTNTLLSVSSTGTETGIFGGFEVTTSGSPEEETVEVLSDGELTNFCVSSDCPILYMENGSNQWLNYLSSYSSASNMLNAFIDPANISADVLNSDGGELVPAFISDTTFVIKSSNRVSPQAAFGKSNGYYHKMGFYSHDRYLIGSKTCGSYFFVSLNDVNDLRVNGNDFLATRTMIAGKEADYIKIPVIFQFRMQDYKGYYGGYDSGTGESQSTYSKNFGYTRKLGFDLSAKDQTLFSFDLLATAKCAKSTLTTSSTTKSSSKSSSSNSKLTINTIKNS